MRIKYISFLILVSVMVASFSVSQENASIEKRWEDRIKKYPIANNNNELQLISTFPNDEKEIFLSEAVSLAHDKDWNIYVADLKNNSIVIFNSKGKYLHSFGQMGQGPGDLSYPLCLSIWKDNIVVYEGGNRRIQFFDFKGKSERIIKMLKPYHDVIISKEGIIYGIPRHIIAGTGQKMIDAFNLDGKLVHSFGEPKVLLMKVEMGTSAELSLINDETEILLVYNFIPIIERYSTDGKLLSSVRITNPIIDDEGQNNESYMSKGEIRLRTIFPAMRIHENKTYLLHPWPRVEILELDENVSIKNNFNAIVNWDFHVKDFLVNQDEEQTTIYCIPSNSYEHMKIHVFEAKK